MSLLDFIMVQNNDKVITLTALDGDGNTIDLTGSHIVFTIMKDKGRPVLVEKTTDDGGEIEILDQVASKGQFDVTLDAADTVNLLGKYVHDAAVTDSSGKTTNLRNIDGSHGSVVITAQYAVQE